MTGLRSASTHEAESYSGAADHDWGQDGAAFPPLNWAALKFGKAK
jgi:hypothetical protein